MNALFSLYDAGFFLPVDDGLPVTTKRRLLAVETLQGTARRDVGEYPSDLAVDMETRVAADDLPGLADAARKGGLYGLTLGVEGYTGHIAALTYRRTDERQYTATLTLAVRGRL